MRAELAPPFRDTPAGAEAAKVIGACVHCGFCLATCPTYRLLGDELDSPRGRIYLMKQVLEGAPATRATQLHLDRCLTCRSCETTCPSGVEYHKLLDTGRAVVDAQVARPWHERSLLASLRAVLRRRRLFSLLASLGRTLRFLLPASLNRQLSPPTPSIPRGRASGPGPLGAGDRRVLLLQGCVQPGLRPGINAAAARVLAACGVTAVEVPAAGCCGALRFHAGAQDDGLDDMRALIEAWWPQVEAGAEAIVLTASGCGAQIRDYGRLLRDDPAYAEKAARMSALARDVSEIVSEHAASLRFETAAAGSRGAVAFQSPCTLQHGVRVRGPVEALLEAAGYAVKIPAEPWSCCGSAGTYSITQPDLSRALRARKLATLEETGAGVIATANIGCLTHLAGGTGRPVRHWIELLDEALIPN